MLLLLLCVIVAVDLTIAVSANGVQQQLDFLVALVHALLGFCNLLLFLQKKKKKMKKKKKE